MEPTPEQQVRAKRCPKCRQAPIVTKEEDFLEADVTWSIFHVCNKGFSQDEGPCISEFDAIEAWNYHVEKESNDPTHT